MRVVIVGCGAVSSMAMKAAMESLSHQIVVANPYQIRASVGDGRYDRELIDYEYSEHTAPNGRSAKNHNLILAMNKKGKKW